MNQIFMTGLFLAIVQSSILGAQEPPSKLHLEISAWLRRISKDDDSWVDRKEFPYEAVISYAGADPELTSFVTKLGQFTKFPSSNWPGVHKNYLESLVVEKTRLTPDQARHLAQVATQELVISNCDISDEVAKSLGSIRTPIFTISNCGMSDEGANSLGGIQCQYLRLKNIKLSDNALTALMKNQKLKGIGAEQIRGCTAEGWKGLSHRHIGVSITDCDFNDDALLHLSTSEFRTIELRNLPITGAGLVSLKTQKDRLKKLILSGCPISDEGLQNLPDMPALMELDLSGTAITDTGLQKLPKMPVLLNLNLCGTAITDDGFRNFVVPLTLVEIQLSGTKVTEAWGIALTRKHREIRSSREVLSVTFLDDPRWPPRGGYCERGEFHFYRAAASNNR